MHWMEPARIGQSHMHWMEPARTRQSHPSRAVPVTHFFLFILLLCKRLVEIYVSVYYIYIKTFFSVNSFLPVLWVLRDLYHHCEKQDDE